MHKIILFIIYLSFSLNINAQKKDWRLFPNETIKNLSEVKDTLNTSTVNFFHDERIGELIERHIRINKEKGTIPGYRIQIFSVSGALSKTKAREVKGEFLTEYPNKNAYLIYQTPNFKIRIGDYRDRLSAERELKIISAKYPNAFIVTDEINLPDLTLTKE